MANYNHGRFLRAALESLARQSIAAREIIIIDDASTDDSIDIIASIQKIYPMIRLLRNERNQGVNVSFARGVAQTTGDYLFFPGADDCVLPGLFEKSITLLAQYPNAGLCSSLAGVIAANGSDRGLLHTPVALNQPGYLSPDQAREFFVRYGNWVVAYSAIYRRAAYMEIGGHDPRLGPSSEAPLNLVLPLRYGACFIPEKLVLWRKLDQGYALKTGHDWRSSLAVVEALERRLSAPDLAGLIKPVWLRAWKRQSLLVTIYELNRRRAIDVDGLLAIMMLMPAINWLDRCYTAGLRFWPEAMFEITKLYIFATQSAGDRVRIARGKIRRLFGDV